MCYKPSTRWTRVKERSRLRALFIRTTIVIALTMAAFVCALSQQSSGRLNGVVRNSSAATVAGIIVIATNQVTSRTRRARTGPDGRYSLELPTGAYRVTVARPYSAKFDNNKTYGEFAIPHED